MDDKALHRLDRMIRMAYGSRGQRLRGMPLRVAWSLVLERAALRLHRPLRRRVRLFWDDDMTVVFPDRVSLMIYRYGVFEEGLTRVLVQLLGPGGVFFDVGTQYGYFTLLGAHLVGPQGAVHSFEPTPRTFGVLRENAGGRANVHLNNIALYRENTTLEFHDFGIEYPAFNSLYEGRFSAQERGRLTPANIQVQARTLDAYVADTGAHPDFIKIDTEGAELDVLRGMGRTLSENHPTLAIEIDSRGNGPQSTSGQILSLLAAAGYEPYEYARGGLVKHQPQDAYVYDNLFFLHPARRAQLGPLDA